MMTRLLPRGRRQGGIFSTVASMFIDYTGASQGGSMDDVVADLSRGVRNE